MIENTVRINPVIYIIQMESPIGQIIAGATDAGICMLEFEHPHSLSSLQKDLKADISEEAHDHLVLLKKEVKLYFEGKLQKFNVPLHIVGTVFQKKVWQQLLTIKYGQTHSYRQQAIGMGNPKAIRAVASANGANKISIIIPCHRVIGADGSLTGYGGGVWRKKYLLELEMTVDRGLK